MAADHAGGAGAEPVWAGGADAYQLRLRPAARAALRARFVNATGSATAADRVRTALRRARAHARSRRSPAAAARAPSRRAPGSRGAPPIIPREAWGADQCPPRARAGLRRGAARLRAPHGQRERVRAAGQRRDRAVDLPLPPQRERLARHRLQLPRRPLRADLRGPRGRRRPARDRRPGAGLQRRLDRRREPRHVHRRRRRPRPACRRPPSCWPGSSSLHGAPVERHGRR